MSVLEDTEKYAGDKTKANARRVISSLVACFVGGKILLGILLQLNSVAMATLSPPFVS